MFYFCLSLILIIFDQISKILTVLFLDEYESFTLIKNIISFTRCHNTGGPWSIFNDYTVLFIIVTFIILIAEFIYLKKHPITNTLSKISLTLINAGAIGNLIDRLFRGYVVDMLEVTFINYPVFNFADTFIVIGCIIMCIYIIFMSDKEDKKEKENG